MSRFRLPLLSAAGLAAAFAAGLLTPAAAPAQDRAAARPLAGYSPARADEQRRLERAAVAVPDSARAERHARAIAGAPHVAGTDGQARTRDYVIAQMRAAGLETSVRTYRVWLPHATRVEVVRLGADTVALDLAEPPIAGDPVSAMPAYPTVNGSSAAGTAEGELVFVNFGLIEDYATLDSLGVSVAGKVVLARYGRSFRGIKAREAEKRGALGLLLYTDPLDDGFVRGATYPDGPMRPNTGVQRGSVFNGSGDPTTPGWASLPDARRVPLEETALPRIPVVPISAANAQQLMRELRGTDIPRPWQGAMTCRPAGDACTEDGALRYHVGPGPLRVRMTVETDADSAGWKEIWNTYGVVRGTDFPEELVIIGAHRDGWGAGAADNTSGTVSVIEAARAVADLAARGERPRRTIVFATWDAEEWGLVGSTEYVEEEAAMLAQWGVAYLNQDVTAQGPQFGGGGSPSLRSTLRDVVDGVPDPAGRGTVYEAWRASRGLRGGEGEPPMGDPGGGSDYKGFYNTLGIPHADWGFGGPAGVYHSAYDTPAWMARFGDPGFRFHAGAARIGAAMALRLANADVVPFDYVEFARTVRGFVPPLARAFTERRWDAAGLRDLEAAITAMETAATTFAARRDAALADGPPAAATLAAVNGALRRVERALTRPSGMPDRPEVRSLIYAADVDNGYSTMRFPGIGEAVRRGDAERARREVADLIAAFGRATAAIEAATDALGG